VRIQSTTADDDADPPACPARLSSSRTQEVGSCDEVKAGFGRLGVRSAIGFCDETWVPRSFRVALHARHARLDIEAGPLVLPGVPSLRAFREPMTRRVL